MNLFIVIPVMFFCIYCMVMDVCMYRILKTVREKGAIDVTLVSPIEISHDGGSPGAGDLYSEIL